MIHIRDAAPADLKALYQIKANEPGYFEECFNRVQAGGRDILLAEKDGRPAGYALLVWRPRYRMFRRLDIPEIQDLNVSADMRRQGIGQRLVEACETRIKNKGRDTAGIAVGLHSSYGPAQRLYVRMGYVPDGAGAAYESEIMRFGEMKPLDDNFTLKLTKALS